MIFIKILIVFDDMISDMLSNKKTNSIETIAVPMNIRLNSTCYFVKKFLTNKSFKKSHLINYQIFTLKTF